MSNDHPEPPPLPPFDVREVAPDLYDDAFLEDSATVEPASEPEGVVEPARDEDDDPAGEPSENARLLAMLAHLTGLFAGIIGPLVIWLIQKDVDAYVGDEAREALNFQLSVFVASAAVGIGGTLLSIPTFGLAMFATLPLILAIAVGALICTVVGAVAAYEGRGYRYRYTWRFVN